VPGRMVFVSAAVVASRNARNAHNGRESAAREVACAKSLFPAPELETPGAGRLRVLPAPGAAGPALGPRPGSLAAGASAALGTSSCRQRAC